MHPTSSVIIFTTLSGAGYGLMVWLVILQKIMESQGVFAPMGIVVGLGISFILVTIGLLSSTFHLGRPERSWRAFSQWRSSWLSREGVLAVLVYPFLMLWMATLLFPELVPLPPVAHSIIQGAMIVLPIITVYATSKIYQSLLPIPAWSNSFTSPLYLGFSLATGGILVLAVGAFYEMPTHFFALNVMALLAITGLAKALYWRRVDSPANPITAEAATGLGGIGKVRHLEGPHTESNYLLNEMGYRIGRKHSKRLRQIFHVCWILSLIAVFAGIPILAVINGAIAIVAERWLFFAEAKHTVTLFYGENEV